MSSTTKSMTVLSCDNCDASISSIDAGVQGTTALRIWASQHGWHYVHAMVPVPRDECHPYSRGKSVVGRSWDFCDACGIPQDFGKRLARAGVGTIACHADRRVQ